MATTPIIAPDGTSWDIPAGKVSDALKAGGKLGMLVTAPDNSKWLVPSERVHDAIAAGGRLMGAPPPTPAQATSKTAVESSVTDQALGTAGKVVGAVGDVAKYSPAVETYRHIAGKPSTAPPGAPAMIQGTINNAVDASAPNVARQFYLHAKGLPNTLKDVPEAAVQTFLASLGAGGEGAAEAALPTAETKAAAIAEPEAPAAALGKLAATTARPASQTGEALNAIPNKFVPPAAAAPAPITKKVVSAAVDDSLGVTPFQAKPGVPIRSQIVPRTASPTAGLTPGHTAVDSSALSSFKYDPEANELHLVTNSNPKTVYVYGDVSTDQAEAFKNAESKGKAWAELKQQGSPLVAKIVNGTRIPVRPISAPTPDITLPPGRTEEDLSPQLQESLRRIRAARAGRQPQ